MARSYSRIASSIWRDGDFVALLPEQKLTYLMLISQADVSPCGVLSVTIRRWATSLGMNNDDLTEALDGLAKSRFVVWDADSEELLIRSFVKWDGGLGNDNRAKAIYAAVDVIRSTRVFNMALRELGRIGADHGMTPRLERASNGLRTPLEGASNAVGEVDHTETALAQQTPDTEGASNALPTGFEGPRVVVKQGDQEPQPLTLIPARFEARDRFEEFWDIYPRRVAKQAARRKWDTLIGRKVDPATIIEGAKRYAAESRGKEPQFVKQPDGWLNAGRWEDETPTTPSRPITPWGGA